MIQEKMSFIEEKLKELNVPKVINIHTKDTSYAFSRN